jgi:ferritin-like metal-binding protein YciE
MPELKARDAKLVQYLNEAYGKERQLETALEAHIAMTSRASYRKRLQDHLKETRGHARAVERRIKQLGGTADQSPLPVPGPDVVVEAAAKVTEVAQRGAALAQGPLHAVRGTGEAEKQLKNAKTEYQDEAEEIANYTAIETLASSVGDRDTAKLARTIRRQEVRMSSFLERLIPALTKQVVQSEIPPSERNGGARRRSSRSRSTSSRTTRRSTSRSGSRTTARRSTSSRSSSRSGSRRTTSARGRSTTSRAPRGRASSGRATGARRSTSGRATRTTRSGGARSGARRTAGSRSGGSRRVGARGR